MEQEFGEMSFEDMLADMKGEGLSSFGTGVGSAVIGDKLAKQLEPINLKPRKDAIPEGFGVPEKKADEGDGEGKKRTRSHKKKGGKKKR